MMGVHMTLLYIRQQHADARRSLLRCLENRQDDPGKIFGGINGSPPSRAPTELSTVGNAANTAIHSVSIGQFLDAVSVFRKYHTQPKTSPVIITLAPPSSECLSVLTSMLLHILGVTTEEELRQRHNTNPKDLGDILDAYTAQPTVKDLEPLESIRLDWVPTWDATHWGKVVVVAESRGLAVPQQKHRTQIKEVESGAQRAKDTAQASEKEMLAAKNKNGTLQSEVKTLKKRVKRLEVDNEQLRAENAAIKEESAAIKAENAAIKTENGGLKQEIVRLNKRIDDMENRQKAMEDSHKETVTMLMAHIALMETRMANLTKAVIQNTEEL